MKLLCLCLMIAMAFASNPIDAPGRYAHCSTYCEGMDTMFTAGGIPFTGSRVGSLDSFIAYNFEKENWYNVDPILDVTPGKRSKCALETVDGLDQEKDSCTVLLSGGSNEQVMKVWVGDVSYDAKNGYSVMWKELEIENDVSERHDFCSTKYNGNIYIHGGLFVQGREAEYVFESTLELIVQHNGSSNITGEWVEHGTRTSQGQKKLHPTFSCALGALNSTEHANSLVLVGGIQYYYSRDENGGPQFFRELSNDIWIFSLDTYEWTQEREASDDDTSFTRSLHEIEVYENSVYMYGGAIEHTTFTGQREYTYPKGLFVTTPGDNPQSKCSGSEDAEQGLWCFHDDPSPFAIGRLYHSCILRKSELICYGGVFGYEVTKTFYRINLGALTSEDLTAVLNETTQYDALVTTFYGLFILVFLVVLLVCISSVQNRRRLAEIEMSMQGSQNRGARLSVVNQLPLVAYSKDVHRKLRNVDEPEADERIGNEDIENNATEHVDDQSAVNEKSKDTLVDEQQQTGDVNMHDDVNHVEPDNNTESKTNEETTSILSDEEGEDCPICLTEFEEEEMVRLLPCNHLFHPDCVDPWLTMNKSCPMCKQDIDKNPQHSAFVSANNPLAEIQDHEELEVVHAYEHPNGQRSNRFLNMGTSIRHMFRSRQSRTTPSPRNSATMNDEHVLNRAEIEL